MPRPTAITALADGRRIADIVDRLRKQGDLTIRERCADIGLDPNNMTDYQLVWRLCRRNGLPTRHMTQAAMAQRSRKPVRPAVLRVSEPIPQHEYSERALELAKQELRRQIILAKEEMPFSPPYLGGGADW